MSRSQPRGQARVHRSGKLQSHHRHGRKPTVLCDANPTDGLQLPLPLPPSHHLALHGLPSLFTSISSPAPTHLTLHPSPEEVPDQRCWLSPPPLDPLSYSLPSSCRPSTAVKRLWLNPKDSYQFLFSLSPFDSADPSLAGAFFFRAPPLLGFSLALWWHSRALVCLLEDSDALVSLRVCLHSVFTPRALAGWSLTTTKNSRPTDANDFQSHFIFSPDQRSVFIHSTTSQTPQFRFRPCTAHSLRRELYLPSKISSFSCFPFQ